MTDWYFSGEEIVGGILSNAIMTSISSKVLKDGTAHD
jgi:hypothetical protein